MMAEADGFRDAATVPDGYGTVMAVVPPLALAWANEAVDAWIERQLTSETGDAAGIAESRRARQVIGFARVPEKLGAVALYLLGMPALVELAGRICGPTALPSHDWMVIKNPGDGRTIEWHQDFTHERRFPAVSVGIHLDDAHVDALRVIRRTQGGRQNLCELRAHFGFDSPGVAVLGVPAGSLVWHDVMLVHGSPALPAGAPRRKTFYVEFRPEEALRTHAGFSAEYVDARVELWAAARRLNRRLGDIPGGDPFERLEEREREAIIRVRTASAQIDLANYCTPLPT